MKLINVCNFKEMPYTTNKNADTIKNHLSKSPINNKNEIINYLRSGICLAACTGFTKDVLDDTKMSGIPNSMTDGKYHWYEDIIYYIDKYNMMPPKDFIEYMKKNNWEVKIKLENIDFDNLEYID